MPGVDNLELARRYAALFSTANPTAIDAVAAPTLVMCLNGIALPTTMTLLERIQRMHAAFPDYHFTVDDIVVQGDSVALRYTGAGTQHGEYRGVALTIPASGKPMRYTGMMLLRIADGRVVEEWTVADLLGMLQQLGMTLTPPNAP